VLDYLLLGRTKRVAVDDTSITTTFKNIDPPVISVGGLLGMQLEVFRSPTPDLNPCHEPQHLLCHPASKGKRKTSSTWV